jgi:hypothetical protein
MKRDLNIKTFMQSHFVFLFSLHVLAVYPVVYFCEFPFTQLIADIGDNEHPVPPISPLKRGFTVVPQPWTQKISSVVWSLKVHNNFHKNPLLGVRLVPDEASPWPVYWNTYSSLINAIFIYVQWPHHCHTHNSPICSHYYYYLIDGIKNNSILQTDLLFVYYSLHLYRLNATVWM